MPTKSPSRSCRTKKKYNDEQAAHISASKCHNKGIYVKAYKCTVCSGWHLARRNKASVLTDLFKKIERERETKFKRA